MTGRERFRPASKTTEARSTAGQRSPLSASTPVEIPAVRSRAGPLPGLDAVGGRVFAGATLEEHLDAGAGHQHDLGVPAAEA